MSLALITVLLVIFFVADSDDMNSYALFVSSLFLHFVCSGIVMW